MCCLQCVRVFYLYASVFGRWNSCIDDCSSVIFYLFILLFFSCLFLERHFVERVSEWVSDWVSEWVSKWVERTYFICVVLWVGSRFVKFNSTCFLFVFLITMRFSYMWVKWWNDYTKTIHNTQMIIHHHNTKVWGIFSSSKVT